MPLNGELRSLWAVMRDPSWRRTDPAILQIVQGAEHAFATLLQDVRVDHRG
ncbi:MAG: hypothetical protein ACE5H7_17010 [Acidiferrobacterales bacterium]